MEAINHQKDEHHHLAFGRPFNTTTALHGSGLFFKVEYTFVLLYGTTQILSRVIIETCEAGRV